MSRTSRSAWAKTPEEWAEIDAQMIIARNQVKDPEEMKLIRQESLARAKRLRRQGIRYSFTPR